MARTSRTSRYSGCYSYRLLKKKDYLLLFCATMKGYGYYSPGFTDFICNETRKKYFEISSQIVQKLMLEVGSSLFQELIDCRQSRTITSLRSNSKILTRMLSALARCLNFHQKRGTFWNWSFVKSSLATNPRRSVRDLYPTASKLWSNSSQAHAISRPQSCLAWAPRWRSIDS